MKCQLDTAAAPGLQAKLIACETFHSRLPAEACAERYREGHYAAACRYCPDGAKRAGVECRVKPPPPVMPTRQTGVTVEVGERFGLWEVVGEMFTRGAGRNARICAPVRCTGCDAKSDVSVHALRREGGTRGCRKCRRGQRKRAEAERKRTGL